MSSALSAASAVNCDLSLSRASGDESGGRRSISNICDLNGFQLVFDILGLAC